VKTALLLLLIFALESSALAESRGRYTSPDQQLYAIVHRGNTPSHAMSTSTLQEARSSLGGFSADHPASRAESSRPDGRQIPSSSFLELATVLRGHPSPSMCLSGASPRYASSTSLCHPRQPDLTRRWSERRTAVRSTLEMTSTRSRRAARALVRRRSSSSR
jgi:hypothetical protein